MGGCKLLYSVKSKNDTKCKNFAVLFCFYVNAFILLYFLRWQEEGATAPLNLPLQAMMSDQELMLACYACTSIR